MKTIKVAAAIICDSMKDKRKIFATARGYGEWKGQWEFPGGKVEEGESSEQALKREIMEELDTEISVGELFDTVEYDYPAFHLSMDCFWAEVLRGELLLKEAEEARWLTREELYSVQWLPADISLIQKIEKELKAGRI
ncbi:MAG: (deoxy)nucleoside triphosphate pyrophosphohydrolase [Lachnospiraceae bacterium]|nr:(deoxy)nucleoside triphosphate pyrophosphohydrolase [Lachnospiraceae bacterium]